LTGDSALAERALERLQLLVTDEAARTV